MDYLLYFAVPRASQRMLLGKQKLTSFNKAAKAQMRYSKTPYCAGEGCGGHS